MKNTLLTICVLLISILTSCHQENNPNQLYPEIYFNLKEGEEFSERTAEVVKAYEDNLNPSISRVPLLKYIKHRQYDYYIGIPFRSKPAELARLPLNPKDSLVNKTTKSNRYLRKYLSDNKTKIEYIEIIEDKAFYNLIVINDESFKKNGEDLVQTRFRHEP